MPRAGPQGKLQQALRLLQAGELSAAEALCREVLVAASGDPDAHHLLSHIHRRRGDVVAASAAVARAIEAAPGRPELHMTLATTLMNAGDWSGAAESFETAARLKPGWFEALANRGIALARLSRHADAESALQDALRLRPDSEPVLTTLAGCLHALGRLPAAVEVAKRAVQTAPDRPEAWTNLGLALQSLGRLSEAIDSYDKALLAAPDYALAVYNRAHVLNDQWRGAEARAGFQRAVELDPRYAPAWHALLFNALYDPQETEQSLFAAHSHWARQLPVAHHVPFPARPPRDSATRRLRVGYMSPDFRIHSCAWFLQPLFAQHDRTVVEIFSYSCVQRPDAMTEWFRNRSEHWRNIHGREDRAIADLVRADDIDILVDLAGHTEYQPLGAFALKPAPVQISWLGYPATTGLAAIDYRLTDAVADPPGDADKFHAEELIRLPHGFHCYRAPDEAPEVSPLPAKSNGGVTFGSFNNLAKLTAGAIATWTRLLLALPDSRLILRARALAHDDARERVLAALTEGGVARDRVDLRGWVPRSAGPLAAYSEVDIALDTFPYNGTTTTFEALWMGVPVITLCGARHAARVGASILTQLGRRDWITATPGAYLDCALRLASDLPALESERRALRAAVAGSSLADASGFTRQVEAVFRVLVRQPPPSSDQIADVIDSDTMAGRS